MNRFNGFVDKIALKKIRLRIENNYEVQISVLLEYIRPNQKRQHQQTLSSLPENSPPVTQSVKLGDYLIHHIYYTNFF